MLVVAEVFVAEQSVGSWLISPTISRSPHALQNPRPDLTCLSRGVSGHFQLLSSETSGRKFLPAKWLVWHSLGVDRAAAAIQMVHVFYDRDESRAIVAVTERHFHLRRLIRDLERMLELEEQYMGGMRT